MNLSNADAEWFRSNPDRQFRCCHQTDAEKGADREALSGPAYGLAIVRRDDRERVYLWSANPDLYLDAEDISLAYWFDHYVEEAARSRSGVREAGVRSTGFRPNLGLN